MKFKPDEVRTILVALDLLSDVGHAKSRLNAGGYLRAIKNKYHLDSVPNISDLKDKVENLMLVHQR